MPATLNINQSRTGLDLSAVEIAELLPMSRAIDLMRDAFRLLSADRVVCPVRLNLPIAEQGANSLVMPCFLPGSGYFGIKTANMFPNNWGSDLPVINSIYTARHHNLPSKIPDNYLHKPDVSIWFPYGFHAVRTGSERC